MFTWVNYEDLGGKKEKSLYLGVNYDFQPSNWRAWGPFSFKKVPQFKHFSSYFGIIYRI